MNKLILLAGAALIAAAPAAAKPGSHGHGHSASPHAQKSHGSSFDSHKPGKWKASATRRLIDRDRDGIDDRDEALARKYGGALCPPGLAKKSPACMPPGQAKRLFHDGQRLSRNYRYYTPYDNIPISLRDRYELNDQYRYIYRNNMIYVVDPTTRLITNIINAVL